MLFYGWLKIKCQVFSSPKKPHFILLISQLQQFLDLKQKKNLHVIFNFLWKKSHHICISLSFSVIRHDKRSLERNLNNCLHYRPSTPAKIEIYRFDLVNWRIKSLRVIWRTCSRAAKKKVENQHRGEICFLRSECVQKRTVRFLMISKKSTVLPP